ncbi:ligand-binding sensor domain-containing protein [Sphingomonas panni]
MRHFVLLILFLAGWCPGAAIAASRPDAWSGWRNPRFQTLDGAEGLPHATTTAIVQSSDGLVWIGTRGGLARYDGQRVKVFRQAAGRRDGLPDNYVRSLLPLANGGLLVGTNVGGLVRFDARSDRFVAVVGAAGVGMGARIMAITSDAAGGAYIASDRGVFHYDVRRDRVDPFTGAGSALAEGPMPCIATATARSMPEGTRGCSCVVPVRTGSCPSPRPRSAMSGRSRATRPGGCG